MNLPEEVVLDLLPLYLAGEVSTATRTLVEDYLRHHPELAERAERGESDPPTMAEVKPPEELGLRTLRRTRRLLARERWLLAFALMFTGFTFSFHFTIVGDHGDGLHWLMADNPPAAAACAVAAGVLWVAFWRHRRQLET
jgi:hypothetical protein